MKITFQKNVLESAVNDSMGSVSDKNTIPVVEGIRFKTESEGKCSVTTYDLEKGFKAEIACDSSEAGNYVINAQKLNRIIKYMPDQYITLTVDSNCNATITSGRSKFELHAMDGESFPSLPELSGDRGFSISGEILKKMVNQVFFAIATSDQRPVLCGALFEIADNHLKIVACDGNRLAVREKICTLENKNKDGSSLNMTFVVPGKTLSQLVRLISDEDTVNIYLGRKHVIFSLENKTFFSRLIDSEYIDYARVIPAQKAIQVKLNRMDMISSLERASLVTEDKALGQAKSYARCNFEGDRLKISSVSVTGSVYDEVPIEKEGNDIVIGFNCRFLLETMRAIDSEKISIYLNTPLMSMVICSDESEKTEDEAFIYMVSPVKMKE